jgi:hypothetical protein
VRSPFLHFYLYCTSLTAGPVYEPIIGFPNETSSVPQSLLLHTDGNLYGSAGPQLYRLTPAGEFTVVGQLDNPLPVPFDTLVSGPDGKLWGVSKTPGKFIFTLDPHTARLKTVAALPLGPASEEPQRQLVSDGNGLLWGTTVTSHADHSGLVYKIDPTSSVLTRVARFTRRMGSPGFGPPVRDGSGNLWGITQVFKRVGDDIDISFLVYRINTPTGSLDTDSLSIGGYPYVPGGPLAYDGQGSIWGTSSGGLVFRMSAESASTTQLDVPPSYSGRIKLVADGAGSMWGTIRSGNSGDGSIFRISAATGVLTTVVEFTGPVDIDALVNDGAGNFWGIEKLSGTLFKVNIGSGEYSAVADFDMLPGRTPNGTKPYPGLVTDGAGNVWGTFVDAGFQWGALERYEGGAIFKVSASDSVFTEVVQFTRPPTSKELQPFRASSLVSDAGGSLWGATTISPEVIGLIYKVDPVTWESTIVAEARSEKEGYFPTQPLMSDGKGSLWGMGNYGIWRAADFKSVVFKVNATTGEVVTVSELPSPGFVDSFHLPFVNDGAGGFWTRGDSGDLLRIDEVSGAVTVFKSPVEGLLSLGALVSDGKGKLWSTNGDGTAGSASILEIDPVTGARRPVISFAGQTRTSALCSDDAGKLWGVLTVPSQRQNSADGTQVLPGHRSIFKLTAARGKLKQVADLAVAKHTKREIVVAAGLRWSREFLRNDSLRWRQESRNRFQIHSRSGPYDAVRIHRRNRPGAGGISRRYERASSHSGQTCRRKSLWEHVARRHSAGWTTWWRGSVFPNSFRSDSHDPAGRRSGRDDGNAQGDTQPEWRNDDGEL